MRAALANITPDVVAWLTAAAMLLATVGGPLFGEPAAFRHANIAIAVLALLGFIAAPERWRTPLRASSWAALSVASLAWFEAVSFSFYGAQRIHGFDFSVFDWQLANTARGHFGYSPIYELNHFGVHSSFVMLVLVPLYWLRESPMWLLAIGPLVLWSAIFPLRRLARWAVGDHGGLLLAVTVAYLANPSIGRVLQEGFRIENALPVLSLWLLVGWLTQKHLMAFAAACALLGTKEDAALWVSTFALAAAFVERSNRRRVVLALAMVLMGAAWLIIYTQAIRPALMTAAPEYLHFWSDFGTTPRDIVVNMARQPLGVLQKIFTSGLWVFFAPLLFLPFASLRATAALVPSIVLLGASNYDPMRRYLLYYAVPLVAFALFGVLEFAARPSLKNRRELLAVLALLAFPLFRGGYAHVVEGNPLRAEGAAQVRALIADKPLVFAQAAIFPFMGYPRDLRDFYRLSDLTAPAALFVVNPSLSTAPFEATELELALARARSENRLWAFEGGYLVFAAQAP